MVLISPIIKSTCCDERAIIFDLEKPICRFLPLGESPLMSHIIFDRRPSTADKCCFVNKNFSYKSTALGCGHNWKRVQNYCSPALPGKCGAHQVSVDVTFDKTAVKIKNHAVDVGTIFAVLETFSISDSST